MIFGCHGRGRAAGETHRGAAPRAGQGRHALRARERFRAEGRPAARDRGARGRARARRQAPGAAGRDRLGQDLHGRLRDRQDQPPDAGARPQQDAGGPALPGVQGVLPDERRRVLRLLLRLLPARGVRPAVRHLHREGSHDQRRDRPAAAQRHAQPVRAARRGDRGLGVVHLRPRLAGGLLRHAAVRAPGRDARPARPARAPRRDALRAQRLRARARHLPRARRRDRDRARLRGERDPHRAVRRRGRAHQRLRPAHRQDHRPAGPGGDLPVEPLRDAPAAARDRREDDRGRADGGEARARGPRQAARGAAALPAHHVRPRDAARDRALPRHRELLAPPLGPQARRAAADAARLPAEGPADGDRRVAPVGPAGARDVRTATSRARRRWSSTASGCRRRSTTARSTSRSSKSGSAR